MRCTIAAKYGWQSTWMTGFTEDGYQTIELGRVPVRLALDEGGKAKRGFSGDNFIRDASGLVVAGRELVIAAKNQPRIIILRIESNRLFGDRNREVDLSTIPVRGGKNIDQPGWIDPLELQRFP
jgi:hypothetical protein